VDLVIIIQRRTNFALQNCPGVVLSFYASLDGGSVDLAARMFSNSRLPDTNKVLHQCACVAVFFFVSFRTVERSGRVHTCFDRLEDSENALKTCVSTPSRRNIKSHLHLSQ
jgi:hypothetical protein